MPLVSVIIPTFNRPEGLRATLESLCAQRFADFEAVVVNDAGADVSSVAAAFADRLRIRLLTNGTNRGQAASRNRGISASNGRYLAFLDDDDIFYPEHLETLVAELERTGAGAVYSDALLAYVSGGQVVERRRVFSQDFDRRELLVRNFLPILSVLFRAGCLGGVGGFDESMRSLEDWDFWIRLSQRCDFRHVPAVTAEYRKEANVSRRGNIGAVMDDRTVAQVREIYRKHHALAAGDPVVLREQGSYLAHLLEREAQALCDAGRLERAAEALGELAELRPSANVFLRLGMVQKRAGKVREAALSFRHAEELAGSLSGPGNS